MAEDSAVETWRRVAAEFGRLPAVEIQRWISDALLELDTTAYGNNIERAKVYMGAHLLKIARLSEEGIPLVFPVDDEDGDLKMTRYGRSLLRLRGQTPTAAPELLGILTITI